MEPRSNEEEPTNGTPSSCDSEKDEPPPHSVQAAPKIDDSPRATVLTKVSIPHQPPVGKPKGIYPPPLK